MTYRALVWHLQQHTVDVIVLGDWITAYGTSSDWIRQLSIQNGYVLNQRIAGIEIYTLPPDARR